MIFIKKILKKLLGVLTFYRVSQLDARISITTTLIASGLTSLNSRPVKSNLHENSITFSLGTYTFKMAINPEYKIPEISFENNAALCNLHYNEVYATIHNCSHIRP